MFTVNTKDFKVALKKCYKVLNKKVSLPVIRNVKVSYNNQSGNCFLDATSLDNYISVIIPARGDVSMAFVFSDTDNIAKGVELFGNEMSISFDDTKVVVSSGNKSVKQPFISSDEFPPFINLEDFNESAETIVTGKDFDTMFQKIKHGISTDDARPVLCCVHFSKKYIETTDGFVLTRLENKIIESEFMLSFDSAKNFNLVDEEGLLMIGMYHDNPMYFYGDEQTRLYGNLIVGNYPEFDYVIPKNFKEIYFIDRKELIDGLKFSLKMECTLSKLSGNVLSGKVEGENSVDIKLSGELGKIEFGFNPSFMLDAIENQFSSDMVKFSINAMNTPILVTDDIEENGLCVVMPMHLG